MSTQLCFSFPSVTEPVARPDSASPAPSSSLNVATFSYDELARRLLNLITSSRSDGRRARPGRRRSGLTHVSEIGSDDDIYGELAA